MPLRGPHTPPPALPVTEMPAVNGRVTQRDLYDAIGGLRMEQREGFESLRRDITTLAHRVSEVEKSQIREQAQDDERALMIREQREIKEQQGISRRWLVGLAVGVLISIGLALVPILMELHAP